RTTPFESLLLLRWYPTALTALKSWSVYDPDPASALITTWQPLLPPWLLYKLLHDLILPKLIEAVKRFPKPVDSTSNPHTRINGSSSRHKPAPDLHTWLFDWWALLSSSTLELERFPELRSLVKSKLTSATWPIWKSLLGSDKRTIAYPSHASTLKSRATNVSVDHSQPSTPAATVEDISFKDIVEEWCTEHNLLLRSTNRSDEFGRLLYRLSDAERKSKGVRVYLLDDVVFSEDGVPYGLDDPLVERARG
ncbi:MAG: hypothetical protein M1823_006412, partial [Watsoniomyces obsoletus]